MKINKMKKKEIKKEKEKRGIRITIELFKIIFPLEMPETGN